MDNWRDVTNTRLFQSSFKGAKLLYGYTPKTWAEHLKDVLEQADAAGRQDALDLMGGSRYERGLGTSFSWRHTELGDAYYRAIYVTCEPRDYDEGAHTFI